MKILLTTTSFQDTPGAHHDVLKQSGFEIVRARGPLKEADLLDLVRQDGGVDGLLNGDDQITARVIDAALPRLKVIAKYGIGLDSIDVAHATAKRIPVLFTPGVNDVTVAEHAIGLMIAIARSFWPHIRSVKHGEWKRVTGIELSGRTIGIYGLGRIGRQVVIRAVAMGMKPIAFDQHFDEDFAKLHGVARVATVDELLAKSDVLSLHASLADNNRGLLDKAAIATMKKGSIVINTARGGLVVEADMADACRSGHLRGYGTDVLEHEPPEPGHPFESLDNVVVTPHVASRTFESVERQGLRAARNVVNYLNGDADYIQANRFADTKGG